MFLVRLKAIVSYKKKSVRFIVINIATKIIFCIFIGGPFIHIYDNIRYHNGAYCNQKIWDRYIVRFSSIFIQVFNLVLKKYSELFD